MAKKNKHEEDFDEGWLLPYSDLMTLLLAVFIVLFATSKVDQKKMEDMADSFANIVVSSKGTGFEDTIGKQIAQGNSDELSAYAKSVMQIKMNMDKYIKENNLTNEISAETNNDKLKIVIANNILYQPGSAEVSERNIELANTIGKLIVDQGKDIEVTIVGHTDNVPVHNNEFEDNIELSQKRAFNFLKNMLKTSGVDPRKFSTAGYGEYQPIASNDTEEGKQLNRRVEILIDAKNRIN
ncbi:flagellar motor protein MotB [Metaclostridioides mangenotii]|uniref:Chemotaxis protein MotB n=1 Tax=Metaclostridioides mangenotii TaxID=1540 RepID=A0ABS4E779_9FIRM|nr:flagellar motor protein MotB [Clostridioides mangenotii]MBP1853794.1 chemotaxis protein MotB [Clostridioides mangenotii]